MTDDPNPPPTYADLVALIEKAEWSTIGDAEGCPWCGRPTPPRGKKKYAAKNHTPDCPAARVLYPEDR